MENILDFLQNGGNLRKLNKEQLEKLCVDIRKFLVDTVSSTGGHLASNLGAVELTVALYKVFDFPTDKLIWDVGHQSYVHKLLSGRADRFGSLRKFGGISGFPKRSESEYDSFNTGHSSTSVSAAVGMARARDLDGDKYSIVAVFGDGALTGGEIFEAFNDAGNKKTPLILILNDNNMSIQKNISAVSKHLRNIRINKHYFSSKLRIAGFLDKLPLFGMPIRKALEAMKRTLRRRVLPTTMFDELGFKYIGPLDGHSFDELIPSLKYAKAEKKPVVIHIKTQKGKGYPPAENDPAAFHGIGRFDAETGAIPYSPESYSSRFGAKLTELAEKNNKVVAITCAMPDGTGLKEFSEKYPDRFFDVGIAEQHGVTLAAGMAVGGYIPVIPIYSTFLQRAFDQVLHDVCLQDLHVVFPVDRAGIVGADGETHQGVYDISYLSCMPNMTILSPSSFEQLDEMLEYAINLHNGPIAIRYPRGGNQPYYAHEKFEIGKAYVRRSGSDVSIITTGRMLLTAAKAANILKNIGIEAEICELPTVLPLNADAVVETAKKTGVAVTIEDNVISGGFGEHIAGILSENNIHCAFKAFGYPSVPIIHGTVSELDKLYGTDAEHIAASIGRMINNDKDQT